MVVCLDINSRLGRFMAEFVDPGLEELSRIDLTLSAGALAGRSALIGFSMPEGTLPDAQSVDEVTRGGGSTQEWDGMVNWRS